MAEKKARLGRGLATLLGPQPSPLVSNVEMHEALKHLPLEHIKAGKYQPRQEFTQEALTELANSIRSQGVIQPILVRKRADKEYEIIAGERRWRAAKLAGLDTIPAIIRELSDEAALASALIENIQREDLNPLEEAQAIQRLLKEFSLTHQQIAEALGKSRTSITNSLRLLTLDPQVSEMLAHGKLEMGHARALLALEDTQQLQAAQKVTDRGLSVRQTEELVKQIQEPRIRNKKFVLDQNQLNLQTVLKNKLKTAIKIQPNAKGGGKLIIKYKNSFELEKIIKQWPVL